MQSRRLTITGPAGRKLAFTDQNQVELLLWIKEQTEAVLDGNRRLIGENFRLKVEKNLLHLRLKDETEDLARLQEALDTSILHLGLDGNP